LVEAAGIIITTRHRIEVALTEKRAFDEKSAADVNDSKLNFQAMLDIMEKAGLVAKTSDGRFYMTKKGQEEQIRGFTIHKIAPTHKIKKYSKNK